MYICFATEIKSVTFLALVQADLHMLYHSISPTYLHLDSTKVLMAD